MAKQIKPTPAELQILQVLWKHGPATVAKIQSRLGGEDKTGYTTVLKFLQIMHEKGLVRRDDTARPHVYTASHSKDSTQKVLVRELLDRVFGGSAFNLVAQALSTGKVSDEELSEIKNLVKMLEEKKDAE